MALSFRETRSGGRHMESVSFSKGLEGVIAAASDICRIDGNEGRLYYRGYSIEDLAAHSSFEEVTYLLLNEHLPDKQELENFSARMRRSRDLDPHILDMIRHFPPDGKPMELLQAVVSYLSGYVEHKIQHSATCDCRNTLHQVVQMASVVAAYYRFREGKEYIKPDMGLSHGGNFLYMMRGTRPEPWEDAIMDTSLVLHAEHGFNASTFTARVVASTLSTCYSSISAAVGALYGSLHGGANEAVLRMLQEIGTIDNLEAWFRKTMEKKQKVMGYGHRIYKTKDPRAVIMEGFLKTLSEKRNDFTDYNMLKKLEEIAAHVLGSRDDPVYPNVDFFSGSVFKLLGIPSYLFTPIFAVGRVSGWLAHILEQRKDNRLYRPMSLYNGPDPRPYLYIGER
ncbi:MAG: citrate/2-methylcitrate synthase [Spirochaetes bacterium]|nr:MAG: citrate/2-methylcitrate synthase [Spirochaetota bacterium]